MARYAASGDIEALKRYLEEAWRVYIATPAPKMLRNNRASQLHQVKADPKTISSPAT